MKVVITANGQGTRMKGLSPLPKHHLHYGDKRIIDHLLDIFPNAEVLEGFPSNSRRETLERIKDYTDCLIVDCDIVILPGRLQIIPTLEEFILCFNSSKDKYSSVVIERNRVVRSSEVMKISDIHCSGVYFIKSVNELIDSMADNSVISGMGPCMAYHEDHIIKLGDPEDYYEALGIKPTSFTGNKITFNDKTVIKHCNTGIMEHWWYKAAEQFNRPEVKYFDTEMIITERIYPTAKPEAKDFIRIIEQMRQLPGNDVPFKTYLDNLPPYNRKIHLKEHAGTFFHGDLSTHNVLKNSRVWLIDPNHKDVFGSWLTDAGKAFFSLVAYEQNYPEAKKIADHFGPEVINFAVAEGLRVCKYKPEYISIVNNIADLCPI